MTDETTTFGLTADHLWKAEPLPASDNANRPDPFVTITRPAHGVFRVTAVNAAGTVTTSEWALIDHAIMNAKDAIHATL